MSQEGWFLDLWTTGVAFRYFKRYKVNKVEDRVKIMQRLTKKKKAKYLRDIQPVIEGKKVIKIGFKREHPQSGHQN